jgi:hypothetical protein
MIVANSPSRLSASELQYLAFRHATTVERTASKTNINICQFYTEIDATDELARSTYLEKSANFAGIQN